MVDYGKGPSKSEWETSEELLNTGAKGWNYLQRLPEVLQKHIPWLRDYIMAFAIENDVDEFSYQGWRPMRTEHFGIEGLTNFNKVVGYRFNLSDVDGVVRYKNQILMLMPKDVRKRQIGIRNEAFEEYYSKVTDEREPYVHPLDSRKEEMREASKSEREEGVLKHDPDMEPGQIRKETTKHKKED